MSTTQFIKLVDARGDGAIFVTQRARAGIRVTVLERETLAVSALFSMRRFPAFRYALPSSKWKAAGFAKSFAVAKSNLRSWELNRRNLVLSTPVTPGPKLERISWHPGTGEMIFSGRGESFHNMDIHNHGARPFNEYVRALVLPELRMVATRPWYPLGDKEARLVGDNIAQRLSLDGQFALRTVLEKAGLPKSWRVTHNTVNSHLEQLSGRRGW